MVATSRAVPLTGAMSPKPASVRETGLSEVRRGRTRRQVVAAREYHKQSVRASRETNSAD